MAAWTLHHTSAMFDRPRHARGRRGLSWLLAGLCVASAPGRSAADPVASIVPRPALPTGAPAPGDESGRVDRAEGSDSIVRVVGRGVLVVPKLLFELHAIVAVRVARPGFAGITYLHLARDPHTGIHRVVGVWRT
jgi:hypothetical protein